MMKIVIDIPEEEYELVRHENKSYMTELVLMNAVAKGIPLPEHHGDLIERNELLDYSYEIDSMYCMYDEVVNVDDIKNAPTIIEGSDSE